MCCKPSHVLTWEDIVAIKLSTTVTPVSLSDSMLSVAFLKVLFFTSNDVHIRQQVLILQTYLWKETYNKSRERFTCTLNLLYLPYLKFLRSRKPQGQCIIKITSQENSAHRLQTWRHSGTVTTNVYPVGSAQKTTKLIYFHPYKVTVVHELMLDYGKRASACLARTSSKMWGMSKGRRRSLWTLCVISCSVLVAIPIIKSLIYL
jgi:hypothetical protein